MALKISDEQRRALAQQPDAPLEVEDPETQGKYVLVRRDLFDQLQKRLPYDDSEPNPIEFLPMTHAVMKDDWDAPDMAVYDNYKPPQKKS